jgi:glycosyltransferase involved in cell wall biosynthesis
VLGVTRLVSVVTAVHEASVGFLRAAYESLAAQALPPGWDWQWLVQEDGASAGARRVLPRDDRISVATGRPFGPGVARTCALARADGELVKVLDADDLLTPRNAGSRDQHPFDPVRRGLDHLPST